MQNIWHQYNNEWWLHDVAAAVGASALSERALPGCWQVTEYATNEFSGKVLFANPSQNAPEIRISLPASGRYSIAVGLMQNYCDRLLLKLEGDRCFSKLSHSPTAPSSQCIEECWWRDVDLTGDEVLVLSQDNAMKRRCNIAFIHLYPAPAATQPEIPIYVTVDGLPGNHGLVELDEMLNEELMFEDTHVTAILHGTDINGAAQYMTQLPAHRYPAEQAAQEVFTDDEYYLWTVQQLLEYDKAGRCPLRDSIEAAHSIGREIYAYYRMAITRLSAPSRALFHNPFFDAHPEWRCIDFDGTPVSRLSVGFPAVREYFLEHLRETVELGADGVCLVFARGWPLVLFEQPVADAFEKRTSKNMDTVSPDDPELLQVRTEFITQFLRDIRHTIFDAASGRQVKIIAMMLATPEINKYFGMDCKQWAQEGLVEVLIPYPYGYSATSEPIAIEEWLPLVRNTSTQLCPVLNRMTYEPAGIYETRSLFLERAESWLQAGVHGFTFWDMDSVLALPNFRHLGYNLGSREGRDRLRNMPASATQYELKMLDGLTVDRYHPGWNV